MPKRVLMCPPQYFNIAYEINPWMNLQNQVDQPLAWQQWQKLYDIYTQQLNWQVDLIEPQPNLPDMVFTANGGLVIGSKVMLANFRQPDRQGETPFFRQWFADQDWQDIAENRYHFEGEGDGLFWRDRLLVGYPWRTDQAAHQQIAQYFQTEVIGLQLVDARFYHLDTCLTPLDQQTIALYPGAFSPASLDLLSKIAPKLIKVKPADALAYGLNACVHEKNIVLPMEARHLITTYQGLGFQVFPTPMSEFKKSGGGVKCLTLEVH